MRLANLFRLFGALALLPLPALAQFTITGVTDKATPYNNTATLTVNTQAGYTYSATLNYKPIAVGAAVACPQRKVIALEADGSGMYTLQALWTMVRERLDVVMVIFANRRYRILDVEMQRTGAAVIGPRAEDMVDIGRPEIDWVKIAESMGVQGVAVRTAGEFSVAFADACRRPGPCLIEAILAPAN